MGEYRFDTINDKDFEVLVKDLLQIDLKIKLQSFKSGKDGGVDLRSALIGSEVVIQVKHYLKSSFSKLKSSLKNEELPKVEKLNPKRYIIATSMELNRREVDEIYDIFYDYMLSPHDIYYNQSLNSILSLNPGIEKKHFKLWLSSSTVLSTLINSAVVGRSKFLVNEIINDYKTYVFAERHKDVIKKLSEEKVVILTGVPGIGKTTLAKIVLYHLCSSGSFQVIEATDRIHDIESVLDFNSDTRQVIFFDDFLGANLLELTNPANGSRVLANFIIRISKMPNKFLIMTSRTTILNQAKLIYESINKTSSNNAYNYILEINDYTRYEKALILYNHLYFRGVSLSFGNVFIHDKYYFDIIDHPNYNPRLIEFITNEKLFGGTDKLLIRNRITDLLDNPSELWEDHYLNNLNRNEKYILQSLFMLDGDSEINDLEACYLKRISTTSFQYDPEVNSFSRGIQTLLGGFCHSEIDSKNGNQIITFSNPSVSDFFISYLSREVTTTFEILKSTLSFEILARLGRKLQFNLSDKNLAKFKTWFLKNEGNIIYKNEAISYTKYLYLLTLYFPNNESQDILKFTFSINKLLASMSDDLRYFLNAMELLPGLKKAYYDVISKFNVIAKYMYEQSVSTNDLSKIRNIFDDYNVNFSRWYHEKGGIDFAEEEIKRVLSEVISEKLLENYDSFDYEIEEVEVLGHDNGIEIEEKFKLETDLDDKAQEYLSDLITDHVVYKKEDGLEIDLDLWLDDLKDEIENEKNKDEYSSSYSYDGYKDRMMEKEYESLSEDERIDKLFE